MRAQGVWGPGFDHKPSGAEVAPNPNLNLANWITQNQLPNPPGGGQRMNVVHACLIPSGPHRGEVLVWDGNLTNVGTRAFQPWSIVNPYYPGQNPFVPPATPYRFHNATLQMPVGQGELFCAGQCWMADGRLLVAGGTKQYPIQTGASGVWEGAKYVWQWDSAPVLPTDPFGKWYQMADLETERWYPTVRYDDTLDHRAIVIGGSNLVPGSNPPAMAYVNSYEACRVAFNSQPIPMLLTLPFDFDRKNSAAPPSWNVSATPSSRQYWGPQFAGLPGFADYPRIHSLGILDPIFPLGAPQTTAPRLFVSGFLTWGIRWAHDKTQDATFTLASGFDIGQMPTNSDTAVAYATSLILPGSIGGISTRIARIGGQRIGITNGPSNMVETVAAGSSPSSWQTGTSATLPNMAWPRYLANVVILPTGDLFAIGGQNQTSFNLTPELLVNGTTWSPMANQDGPRDYHSTAILLPDARVLVLGGENRTKDYQIWSPPYFFPDWGGDRPAGVSVATDPGGVPVSTSQIAGMGYNQQFRATWTNALPAGIDVDRVVLMRPAAVTHHDDGGQLCVRLAAWHDDDATGGGQSQSIVFKSPAGVLHAPPGWYMLFLLTSAGVPANAYWVNLG